MSDTPHNAQTAETTPVAPQGGESLHHASSAKAGAENAYVKALESAVMEAEWWMADPQVAARKDPRGERKRAVYEAADAVREKRQRGREGRQGRNTNYPISALRDPTK